MLAASYTYTSDGTFTRQEHLRAGKFFTCHCDRCLDPTELGTDFSSIRCRKCNQPEAMIVSTNPLGTVPQHLVCNVKVVNVKITLASWIDPSAQWQCRQCHFCTTGAAVQQALALIQQQVDDIESMPLGRARLQRSETFLNDPGHALLADNHHLLTAVRHSLISMYGRVAGYKLDELSPAQLQLKIELCRRVLAVLDVVHPGRSRARALMLYELHGPLVRQARAEWAAGTIGVDEWRSRLCEATDMLQMCAEVLGWEAINSTVAQVALVASETRINLLREFTQHEM